MRRLTVVVSGIVLTVIAPANVARAQQQQGERAPQIAPTTRAEVLTFVRGYIDAHNRADATALSDAVSHRTDVTSVGDGTITRGWDAIRTETDQITGRRGASASTWARWTWCRSQRTTCSSSHQRLPR